MNVDQIEERYETFPGLPDLCASRLPTDNTPILIKRGQMGYYPAPNIDPDEFNAERGITDAQKQAMEAGSMFGWHVPGANPENCG